MRDYAAPVNQRKLVDWSSEKDFDPAYSVRPSVDASNGPPLEDSTRQVLSGNGRHQIQERVYAAGGKAADRLRSEIADEVSNTDIPNAADLPKMKKPTLRLEISDEEFAKHGPNARQNLIADTNKPGTAGLTPGEQAISDSRRVSTGTLDDMAARLDAKGPKATIAQALDGKAGGEVMQKLINDGVVSPQEQAGLVDDDGELTKAGKDRVSQLMVGRFFKSSQHLDNVPDAVRGKIERIAAPLAQVEAKPGWNLSPDVQSALELLDKARKGNVDDFIKQDGFFGKDKWSDKAVAIAKALQVSKSAEVTAAARQYAQDAAYADKGPSLLGDTPTPAQSFKDSTKVDTKRPF